MKLFKFLSVAVFLLGFAVLSFAADHVIVTESKHDFKTTVAKVKTCIKNNKQATLFNEIDHQKNAKKASGQMGPASNYKGAKDHPFIKGISGMLAKMVENVNK